MATEGELAELVAANIQTAVHAVNVVQLSRSKFAMLAEGMAADLPKQRTLRLGHATKAWCAILFVDLRGSTSRAKEIGAAQTYITMHALLPALAYLVKAEGGYIVGFRGDGLFACFGLNEFGENPELMDKGRTVINAAYCGQTMFEGVERVVNPLLVEAGCLGDLRIGVGIDVGEVVFTKIGLTNASEITAYGDAVNAASKAAGGDWGYPRMSGDAYDLYPTTVNGQAQLQAAGDQYSVQFPVRALQPTASIKTAAVLESIRSR